MFNRRFKIVSVVAVIIILLMFFGRTIIDKIGSVDKITTFTESKSITYYKKSCTYEDSMN